MTLNWLLRQKTTHLQARSGWEMNRTVALVHIPPEKIRSHDRQNDLRPAHWVCGHVHRLKGEIPHDVLAVQKGRASRL